MTTGAGNQPIPSKKSPLLTGALAPSLLSTSPFAHESLARDLAALSDEEDDDVAPVESDGTHDDTTGPTLYRRPSGIAFGTIRPALGPGGLLDETAVLTRAERARSREAERTLLRDNHILLPKHNHGPPKSGFTGFLSRIYQTIFSTKVPLPMGDEEAPRIVISGDETAPLLGDRRRLSGDEHLNEQWEAAVAAGQIRTTWQREAKTIAIYSRSLIVTFFLQYSLNIVSIFAVARLGTVELGAVSLASMTANITLYAPIQGLCTCLDTLCSQAFGSGKKELVGLQLQRMIYFLLLFIIPVGVVWFNSQPILEALIEKESAAFAAAYLRIILLGAPAYAFFEAGKRFVQAQGLFQATTYVLLVAAPTNALMSWLFVWHLGWGFNGAPLAVALTQNLLPCLLFLYVWKVDGSEAWGGFKWAALRNWGPMIRLALPGMIMVVAEWFAFEILTLAAGRIGVEALAAQSILVTVTSTTFQLSFPIGVAGSTRVANLIGAKLVDAAKLSAKVTAVCGLIVGLFNLTVVTTFRYKLPLLFSHDPAVIEMAAAVLPLCAFMQVFDGIACVSHGLLRGIGRQEFGGYANLACYYIVALPISFGLGFGLDMGLPGLWVGVTIGLGLVAFVEQWFIWASDWDQVVREAEHRNAAN
ncbi:ethionine resistance-conferring protein 1 [Podospora fimiseda]|uniref:Ethionine resistance-conferring protein 1 n=1 Tax=Podospora fimiseda TaxID=252190 RepID=A0AAN7H567_9PEZI|nr:ethionine resistance-conferring protein 1 [Podospora fimiseda]